MAIAKPLIIAIAAMYLFFLKIFVLTFLDVFFLEAHSTQQSTQGVLFSSHLKINKKAVFWINFLRSFCYEI